MIKKLISLVLCVVCLFFGYIAFFEVPSNFKDECECIEAHYPDKFVTVSLIKDGKSDNELAREYVFNNLHYEIEIDEDEVDSTFYVCSETPSVAYTDKDIINALDEEYRSTFNLITRVMGGVALVLGLCFLVLVIKKKKVQPTFNNYNNSGLNGLGNISTPGSNYYNNPMANGSITVPQQPMNQGYPQQNYPNNQGYPQQNQNYP